MVDYKEAKEEVRVILDDGSDVSLDKVDIDYSEDTVLEVDSDEERKIVLEDLPSDYILLENAPVKNCYEVCTELSEFLDQTRLLSGMPVEEYNKIKENILAQREAKLDFNVEAFVDKGTQESWLNIEFKEYSKRIKRHFNSKSISRGGIKKDYDPMDDGNHIVFCNESGGTTKYNIIESKFFGGKTAFVDLEDNLKKDQSKYIEKKTDYISPYRKPTKFDEKKLSLIYDIDSPQDSILFSPKNLKRDFYNKDRRAQFFSYIEDKLDDIEIVMRVDQEGWFIDSVKIRN